MSGRDELLLVRDFVGTGSDRGKIADERELVPTVLALFACSTCSNYDRGLSYLMTSATLAKTAAEQIAKLRPAGETADAFLEAVAENYIARELPRKGERARLLQRARARGAALKAKLQQDGEFLSSEALAEFLGIRRQAIDGRRKSGKLVAWRDQRGHWQFPLWQFDLEKKTLLPGISECLRELPDDDWSRMLFFLTVDEALSERERPIDLLRTGEQFDAVIKSAERYGRHGE
ncbi:MAG TPA: hypothetical protein VE641_16975 [Chthoniobacterales bacterium]|nr:hypothetical protein [Chthoniobacterales bacterium]